MIYILKIIVGGKKLRYLFKFECRIIKFLFVFFRKNSLNL